jgi:hypothetical protein
LMVLGLVNVVNSKQCASWPSSKLWLPPIRNHLLRRRTQF